MKSEDVSLLMKKLGKYSYKWRGIGIALEFENPELECIFCDSITKSSKDCLNELLMQWTQWPNEIHDRSPTIKELRDAFRSQLVGLGAVANDLLLLQTNR